MWRPSCALVKGGGGDGEGLQLVSKLSIFAPFTSASTLWSFYTTAKRFSPPHNSFVRVEVLFAYLKRFKYRIAYISARSLSSF